jgi:hypothetical protein
MKSIKQFLLRVNWPVAIVSSCLVAIMINGIFTAGPVTSIYSTSYPGTVRSFVSRHELIQENGKAVRVLLDFLNLFQVEHQGTIESINAAMQTHFIRKPGAERWDLVDPAEDRQLRPQAMKLLKRMGMVEAMPRIGVNIDYFLLFGATLSTMEKRFADFVSQYKTATIECKSVVLLGGVRYLQPAELDSLRQHKAFSDFLKDQHKTEASLTEADLWRFIWQTKATAALKAQFQESKHNLFFVNATDVNYGTNLRATTHAAIEAWLEDFKPAPGKCHANIEKPYGVRMEQILRYALEKYSKEHEFTQYFSITWNSPAASDKLLLAVYKDELARAFYQEYELKKYLGMLPNQAVASEEEKK